MPVSSELQHEGAGDLPNVTLSLTHTQTHTHTQCRAQPSTRHVGPSSLLF